MARPTSESWRDLRGARNLSLRELEESTGINRGALSQIERGRLSPTPDQAIRLLVALGRVALV